MQPWTAANASGRPAARVTAPPAHRPDAHPWLTFSPPTRPASPSQRAEKYVKEYKSNEAALVRNRRVAKQGNNFFVEPEARLAFVVRIRGINGVPPRVRKILQLLRLRQIHNGVFVRLNSPAKEMLRLVSDYVAYGYVPSFHTLATRARTNTRTTTRLRLVNDDPKPSSLNNPQRRMHVEKPCYHVSARLRHLCAPTSRSARRRNATTTTTYPPSAKMHPRKNRIADIAHLDSTAQLPQP